MLRPNTIARTLFRGIGYDLVRVKHSPQVNLLGLRNYPIRSILDIGANVGQFARQARREFPAARIWCFEPLPAAYRQLEQWAREQDPVVSTQQVAVGDAPGTVRMFHHVEFHQSSSLLPTTETSHRMYDATRRQEPVTVEVETLDALVERLDPAPEPEILIKADVQGYEDRVIAGGRKTLAAARACLLEACLQPLYESQASFENLVAGLAPLGLHYAGNLVQYCGEDGRAVFVDALFVRE